MIKNSLIWKRWTPWNTSCIEEVRYMIASVPECMRKGHICHHVQILIHFWTGRGFFGTRVGSRLWQIHVGTHVKLFSLCYQVFCGPSEVARGKDGRPGLDVLLPNTENRGSCWWGQSIARSLRQLLLEDRNLGAGTQIAPATYEKRSTLEIGSKLWSSAESGNRGGRGVPWLVICWKTQLSSEVQP